MLVTTKIDIFHPLRQWLEAVEINNPETARFLCKLIPSNCPFERELKLFGRTLFKIPPMCKLNPLYEQIISLRFKSLTYLADVCGENIMVYL